MASQPNLPPEGALAEFDDFRPSRTSKKATASLLLGLCAFLACCVGIPPLILLGACIGVPAIIVGMLGLRDINNPIKRVMGKGRAKTGIALGTFTTIVMVLAALGAEGIEPSRRAMCENNLKQLALAMHAYESQHGTLPPAAECDADGKPLLSWRILILPYLEQQPVYEQFHLDEPWDSPHNKPLADRMRRVFQCPSEQPLSERLTKYQVIVDPRTMLTGEPMGVPFPNVTDGTSNTLLVMEAATLVPWTKPEDLALASPDPLLGIGSKDPGRSIATMADGNNPRLS